MNRSQLIALRGIGLFLVGLAAGLVVAGRHVAAREATIRSSGVDATATVVERQSIGVWPRRSHFLVLKYPDGRGGSIVVRRQVPGHVFAQADRCGVLPIRHDRDNPADFVCVDFPYNVHQRYAAGAVMMAVGLAASFFAFRAELPPRRPAARSSSPEEAAHSGGES